MKTIEEKAKAYDEAIKRIENIKTGKCETTFMFTKGLFEYVFPALKEDEDERIRKALVKYFSNFDTESLYTVDITEEEAIAWLEKQKPSDAALEYLKENHSPSEVSDFQAAMNIAVAKAYDRGIADAIKQDPCRTCDHHTMSCINFPCEKKKQAKQKPTEWSKEDYYMLGKVLECIRFAEDHYQLEDEEVHGVDVKLWLLKSLRPQPKQEWSEEDEEELQIAIDTLVEAGQHDSAHWLKSIKDRVQPPTWKPSDEQMLALEAKITIPPQSPAMTSALIELYQQLKKLKEK